MANPKPSGSIAAEVCNIKSLFGQLVDANWDENTSLSASIIQDIFDRFKLWAGSLGAMHQPQSKLSLEQRLIRAPEILVHVREHLSEMQESLHDALDLNNQSSQHSKSNIGPAGQEVGSVTECIDQDEVSAEELVKEISECIRSLFRIAIVVKRASPRDRFAQALKSSQYAFMDMFDIDYVAQKFPKLQSSDNTWLKRRLGSAIAKRRQFIKYCYEHKLRLEAENDDLGDSERQSTKATTLIPDRLNEGSLEETEDDDGVSFATATTVSDSSKSLSLPKLEALSPDGEPFECPICCTLQTYHHDKSWKLHAFGDLKAYVCTRGQSEKCERLFFADRSAWFQHELSMHLSSYRCSLCGVKSTSGRDGLRQHLNDSHGGLTHEQLSSLVDTGICIPTFFRPHDCPFCEDWSMLLQQRFKGRGSSHQKVSISRLRRHVATHQEDLALFAMPRNIDLELEESSPEPISDGSGSHHSTDQIAPTSLELALEQEREEIEKLLLSRGASNSSKTPGLITIKDNLTATSMSDREIAESIIDEGIKPHNDDGKSNEVPSGALWTKISRKKVNPEALTIGKERFEERDGFVVVLRVLSHEEIQLYTAATAQLREKRRRNYEKGATKLRKGGEFSGKDHQNVESDDENYIERRESAGGLRDGEEEAGTSRNIEGPEYVRPGDLLRHDLDSDAKRPFGAGSRRNSQRRRTGR